MIKNRVKKSPCMHPAHRLYAWHATDCTTQTGYVLVVACCDCGRVLQGKAND